MRGRVAANSAHLSGIIEDRGKGVSPNALIMTLNQQAAVVIAYRVPKTPDVGRNNWAAARLRLERNQSE